MRIMYTKKVVSQFTMEGKPPTTKATPKIIIQLSKASSSGKAELTEAEFNEYLENTAGRGNRGPIFVAQSVREELFG